mgnify:CR=1 FL=1
MQKSCSNCQISFEITDDDLAFYDKVSPMFDGKKYDIPPPTHCPDCREQRRLAVNNEQFLYPSSCDLCAAKTLTEHPPHAKQPIYCRDCWHSDKWDPRDYGRDFDFNRPFFDQWKELKRASPAPALSIQGTVENCDYVHLTGDCKNCYLIMHADHNEDCYYGYGVKKCRSCVDSFNNFYCELCYDSIDCHRCYGLIGSRDCINCGPGAFLRDCVGCKDCFLCTGLREKTYCFENEQLSKEEYEARRATIDLGSYDVYQRCKARLKELELSHTFKAFQGHNLENCTGSQLYNCKNVQMSFDCDDVENGKFLYQIVLGAKDVYDAYQYGNNFQMSYENSICGLNGYNYYFCHETHWSNDMFYGWYMENCKNCFGCANMHHMNHCILNKQYSPEEYEQLVPQIIEHMRGTGEWGEFLPLTHILHGYNKTTAALHYPMSKDDVFAKGIPWDDYEPPPPEVKRVIPAAELPDNISDAPSDLTSCAIQCEVTGNLFIVTAAELKFYQSQQLPLPRRHWNQRHEDRFHARDPRKLWDRTCAKCKKEIQTTYAPERPETVYCESCYLDTVY